MTLQYITHCGSSWMVGLDGRSTDGVGSGGTLDGEPFVAFGAEDLSRPAPTRSACPQCGKQVRVQTSVSKPK